MDWRNTLTLSQAARRLRRHPELVRQWLSAGRLAGRKVAGRWFISVEDLRKFREREPERRRREA
jgi:hypothetical protein